jgi:hypothetical protein
MYRIVRETQFEAPPAFFIEHEITFRGVKVWVKIKECINKVADVWGPVAYKTEAEAEKQVLKFLNNRACAARKAAFKPESKIVRWFH